MKTDLQSFINLIKAKTGIEFSVCPFNESSADETKYENGIVQDIDNGITLFCIEDKNKKYLCKIEGATEHQKRYAVFITELATDFFKQEDRFLL